ncbi:MAG: GntR family transcriptional regulator [Thermodesulfobacteriota bacterium]|nr:GntR family transcriptional regulator [Thermodesulfobacteriota bacterium]
MFKAISKERNSLATVVFNDLKKAIFSGQLKPGERLIESTLASQFGVSSIPLREAIKKLEAERLVEVIPYKGARVVKASPSDIEDTYTIVGILEGYAAKLATSILESLHIDKMKKLHQKMQDEGVKKDIKNWLKVNNEFHCAFVEMCNRPNLMNLIYEKIGPLGRYWYIATSIPGVIDDGIGDHGRIIRAFEERDSDLARFLVENHRIFTGQRVKECLVNLEAA